MATVVKNLKTDKTTAEIQLMSVAGEDLDIRLPLTLDEWNLTEYLSDTPGPVTVTSADGDMFIGKVTDVDEARYIVTVELA